MKQTFLTKVSYTKQFDNGTFKRVVEQYLFNGHTFTDCEANVYTHLGELIRGEFTIMKMDRFLVDDVLGIKEGQEYSEEHKFFVVKQTYTDIDSREIKMKLLVYACDVDDARLIVIDYNEDLPVTDPQINSIVETKILDYFQSAETIEE
jgi:hypothetical protein